VFEGNELRYNRYFYALETGDAMFVDMVLNRELWNLILATVEFETVAKMNNFVLPFTAREITQDESLNANLLTVKSLEGLFDLKPDS
jgi:hypothetical protein